MIQFVERGAIRFWTESIGEPGRPCALLIFGAAAHAAFWPDESCGLLAGRGLFVIRFDHRDIGYSTPIRADYDIFALLDDAPAILDAYGVDEDHLVGNSMDVLESPLEAEDSG